MLTSGDIGSRRQWLRLCAGLLFCSMSMAGHTENLARAWRVDPSLSLNASTGLARRGGDSDTMSWASMTASAKLVLEDHPCDAGAFASYQVSGADGMDGIRSLGAWGSCSRRRWTATNWLVAMRPRDGADQWFYGAGLGYDVTDRTKLLFDVMAPIADSDAVRIAFGYSGKLAEFAKLTVLVGSDARGNVDVAANLEMSWDFL